MARPRAELHQILEEIGTKKAYFQPTPNLSLEYPGLVYELSDIDLRHANNKVYLRDKSYTITLIDRNPDSSFVDALLELPMISFDRHFKADNLNHYAFTIFF